MDKTLCSALAGLCVAASMTVLAGAANAQPRLLTAGEMDNVTAGLQLGLLTGALATGGTFSTTAVNGAAAGTQTPVPGGGYVESGLVGGTAAAFSNGGATSTGVLTSGSINGSPLVNSTVGGTVASPVGQASFGFTYVSGGTYFLP